MRIGLCGWTINAADYFREFDALEVQQTFYEPPSRLTMDRWRDEAPPGFVFTIKAWQIITHRATSTTYRRLRTEVDRAECGAFRLNATVLGAWKKTVECARLLRARAILFQCPASFRPSDENVENLRRFFAAVERMENVVHLWEPRGAWPDDLLRDLCRELNLVHAVDPFLRASVTPELIYWRLHGIGSHYRRYSDDELRDLAGRLAAPGGLTPTGHSEVREAYVMFNNIPRVEDAKRFRSLVTRP